MSLKRDSGRARLPGDCIVDEDAGWRQSLRSCRRYCGTEVNARDRSNLHAKFLAWHNNVLGRPAPATTEFGCLMSLRVGMTKQTCFWTTGRPGTCSNTCFLPVSFCSRAGYCLITTFWYWAGCSSIACIMS